MVRISKKAKIEPVREANELAVENEYVTEEKKELTMKEQILEDVKKACLNSEAMGMSAKVSYDVVEAILNKYM